ncbi:SDR family NAD(P)-dependent oxidoreductase [Williamsia maris]|uniref:Short-chain dehydrogenase n=1 Tax=Williamsia maris TaxID=72806 RepID=A0ABT1HA16_9NOCA|nr:SDR family NAD(P)-dependent oxidoreductase [Williamsia maris]MCP2175029.1 Short-chain dehydrogenase [Williamsia maris]
MNPSPVAGQVLVITGGAGGLGAAAARMAAERGARVVLLDRDADALARAAADIPVDVGTYVLDVTDPAACTRVIDEVIADHGRIDVVWANAGVSVFGPVDSLADGDWQRVIDVNLVGAHNIVRAALPAVLSSRGYVAMTCSWASFAHQPGHSAYAAAKAGLEAFADSLRLELSGTGVDVGSFHPGWIDTAMVSGKLETQPAFAALLGALPGPFGAVSTVDAITPHLVSAIERRASRMIYPRVGWGLLLARAALQTSVFTHRSRKVAPEIRRLSADA